MSAFEIVDIMIGEGRKTFNNPVLTTTKILPDLSLFSAQATPVSRADESHWPKRQASSQCREASCQDGSASQAASDRAGRNDNSTTETEDTFSPRVASTDKPTRI